MAGDRRTQIDLNSSGVCSLDTYSHAALAYFELQSLLSISYTYQSRNQLGAYTVPCSLISRCKNLQALAEALLLPGLMLDEISNGTAAPGRVQGLDIQASRCLYCIASWSRIEVEKLQRCEPSFRDELWEDVSSTANHWRSTFLALQLKR